MKQDGDLEQMIWNVPEIIYQLSAMVELAAGDVIMTGTPAGVGALGDKIECEIEGVGTLTVTMGPMAVVIPEAERSEAVRNPCFVLGQSGGEL